MNFHEIALKRRSVRSFSDKQIPKEVIEKIIDVARLSPTARNIQPWNFVVITNKETLKKIANLAQNGKFLSEAPVCIAVFAEDTKYYLEDGCAATTNILNSAADLGVDSCWIAGDKKDYCHEVSQILSSPNTYRLISLIALGYAKNKPILPGKKLLKDLIHWERF